MLRTWTLRLGAGVLALVALLVIAVAVIDFTPGLLPRVFSILHRDNEPRAPFRIAGDLYYVGASDIASYLIVTGEGLILIDGGYDSTAPQILANIRRLGFDPQQVRILLNTHAHIDHAGGLARLKRETHAALYASPRDAVLLEAGGHGDFFFGDKAAFAPVHVDHLLKDGEPVRLGGAVLTAHFTPGHTKGCTTWTFPVVADGATRQALVLCSVTILPGYKLVNDARYPTIAADYAKTFATLRGLPCEVFLGSHGMFFGLSAKRAAQIARPVPNPFVDPVGCRRYLAAAQADFERQLARQQRRAGS